MSFLIVLSIIFFYALTKGLHQELVPLAMLFLTALFLQLDPQKIQKIVDKYRV
ncbi:MAG: hypothetical protein M0P02_01445 [Sulfurospirillaceae bacterium]|nr:hypothetical protein [Sulfurospirillaceae bacterium]MCK9545826.1 hypothetical protein [Sulfurospirillaceae bacterium]